MSHFACEYSLHGHFESAVFGTQPLGQPFSPWRSSHAGLYFFTTSFCFSTSS